MPQYTYNCDKCDSKFEITSSIAEYKSTAKCPSCNTDSKRSFIDDKQVVFDGVPRTLGALADLNAKKKGI